MIQDVRVQWIGNQVQFLLRQHVQDSQEVLRYQEMQLPWHCLPVLIRNEESELGVEFPVWWLHQTHQLQRVTYTLLY